MECSSFSSHTKRSCSLLQKCPWNGVFSPVAEEARSCPPPVTRVGLPHFPLREGLPRSSILRCTRFSALIRRAIFPFSGPAAVLEDPNTRGCWRKGRKMKHRTFDFCQKTGESERRVALSTSAQYFGRGDCVKVPARFSAHSSTARSPNRREDLYRSSNRPLECSAAYSKTR